jgi:hypothetical protein
MPTSDEIAEAMAHIEWELAQAPPDRDSQMAVAKEQVAKLRPDLRAAVSGPILTGMRIGMAGNQTVRWLPIAGVAFATFFALCLFYLLIGPDVPPNKHMVFNVWTAFCLAASSAFIGGRPS